MYRLCTGCAVFQRRTKRTCPRRWLTPESWTAYARVLSTPPTTTSVQSALSSLQNSPKQVGQIHTHIHNNLCGKTINI